MCVAPLVLSVYWHLAPSDMGSHQDFNWLISDETTVIKLLKIERTTHREMLSVWSAPHTERCCLYGAHHTQRDVVCMVKNK
jgi:hypothetical protein